MRRPIPLGIDDFRHLREEGLTFVDKSHMIRELLDLAGAQVTLLPRPRRFGKSLNLSMLRWFFEKRDEDLSRLFEDLAIWRAGDKYREHFQRYPVIHLSFKGTKAERFEDAWAALRSRIQRLFDERRYLLQSERLTDLQRRDFQAVVDGTADPEMFRRSLLDLSACLEAHHGEKVVILLDEYDEPIHAGYSRGYAKEMLDFMRALFIDGLKGNPHLFRAVVTGILRVSKESLFSGANNIGVFTLLDLGFRTCFGFTEPEVVALLEDAGRQEDLAEIRAWYNGYRFGGEVVYNPWSIMSYLLREERTPRAYWVSTSSNDLLQEMLQRWALSLEPVFETLLDGGSVERALEENVSLGELGTEEEALFGLLVFAGYLKAEAAGQDALGRPIHRLSIPNREVRLIYATSFRRWMQQGLRARGGDAEKLGRALLQGDAETVEGQLQRFVENILSHHDVAASDPERVYQGFVLGLLAVMEPDHLVRSNRESGHGRPDVTIRPRVPGKPGVILELKVARKGRKTPAAALREGLSQIRENDYEAELRAAGATEVHSFAVAFDGKRVWVKLAAPKPARRPAPRKASKRRAPRKPPAKPPRRKG